MKPEEHPGDKKFTVRLSARDQELLLDYTLVDPEYGERLRPAPKGKKLIAEYSYYELEEILGFVAAEANHTEDRKIVRELDALWDRLLDIQESFGVWP